MNYLLWPVLYCTVLTLSQKRAPNLDLEKIKKGTSLGPLYHILYI